MLEYERTNKEVNIMKRVIRKIMKTWYKLTGNDESFLKIKIEQFKEWGGVCGLDFKFYGEMPVEPYLVEIGNDVTIAAGAKLLTHDNSIIKCNVSATDYFGRIKIGNSCFLGTNSILLPGVTLGNHTIVGAGSVVTKSFPEGNVVIAGNPAKIICTTKEFADKKRGLSINMDVDNRRENKKEFLLSLKEEMFEKK